MACTCLSPFDVKSRDSPSGRLRDTFSLAFPLKRDRYLLYGLLLFLLSTFDTTLGC
jgi:hypothetical protein